MKEDTNLNLLAGVPESLDKPGVFVSNLDKLNVPGTEKDYLGARTDHL